MSIVEQARTRLEEARDRIKTRVESVRGSGSSSSPELLKEIREKGVLGALRGSSSSPELLKEIREKGVLTVLEDKFPRVKEIREGGGILGREGGILGREGGILGRRMLGEPRREPEPRGEVAGEVEGEGMVTLRVEKGIHGEAI